jgi:pimeloyl-ACP methyl ester carboxylesterase
MGARVSCAAVAFVEVRGMRLHYQQWGQADSVAGIVLVHGLGSSSHIWDLVAPILAEQSLRVVALDQRGHGQSDQPDAGYDFESVVADLAGFVAAIGLTHPSVVVGHSWGASVVLHYAVRQPKQTAGIALVDGGTGSPGERMTWAEAEKRLRPPDLDGMRWTDLYERLSSNNGAYPPARANAVWQSLFDVDAEGRVTRRFRIPNHMQVVRALWEQRPAELLGRVECPILILPARQSTESSEMAASKGAAVARAQQLQPRARVRWFENTVHDVPLQRPEELAAELLMLAGEVLRVGASPS